jgi:NhaP-type Na+/H+ or K+/H+ antiporter
VLLLIIFVDAGTLPGMATVQAVIVTTVLLSVFAHGISAAPLIQWYAKNIEALPENAREREDVTVDPARESGS